MPSLPMPMDKKYDLLVNRRHFTNVSNAPSSHASNFYPVGQWPVQDHGIQKAHYPEQWNMPLTNSGDSWRPGKRYLVADFAPLRPSRVRCIPQKKQMSKGHFTYTKLQHFDQHNQRSTAYKDITFDRLKRATMGGRPGEEYTVENRMARKVDVLPRRRRNGVGECKPGDKSYGEVERSDMFWAYGSTVAHDNFGNLSGGHNVSRRAIVRGQQTLGTSTRSDDFGRATSNFKSGGANKVPYKELQRRAAREAEVNAVLDLPDEIEAPAPVEEEPVPSTRKGKKK